MTGPLQPQRFVPPGDGPLRDSILECLELKTGEERLGLALYFAVDALEMLGNASVTPSAKRVGLGTADALRAEIPGDTIEFVEHCKRMMAETAA